jgi:signal transduction histidine kinase
MIDTGKRQLSITTRRNGETVQLITSDTGQGVSEESLPKIFDAFYSTKPDGMGIGLSISRSIVESHDGNIFARTLDSGGAEFTFELPIYRAA